MVKHSFIFKVLTFGALATLLVMSLRPAVSVGSVPHMDKLVHFGAYAFLAGLMRLGWPKIWGGIIFIALVIFGTGIEFAQHFMAIGRTGSLADTFANILGAALALVIFHIFWTRHRR